MVHRGDAGSSAAPGGSGVLCDMSSAAASISSLPDSGSPWFSTSCMISGAELVSTPTLFLTECL